MTAPIRDVDVTYQAKEGGQTVEQRSRFRASDQKLRLDTPSPGFYMIVDQQARTMALVSDPDRGVVDMRLPGAMGMGGMAPGQSYVRQGLDVVAGLSCVEWDTQDNRGLPTTACFTADGVLMRARRGAQVIVVATRVTYLPQDDAVFRVPDAYAHVAAQNQR